MNHPACPAVPTSYIAVSERLIGSSSMRTLSELRGFIKLLIATDSDRILGLTVFGTEASELMAAVQTAMLGGLPYTLLRDAIFAHPTTAEGLNVLLRSVPAQQARKAA